MVIPVPALPHSPTTGTSRPATATRPLDIPAPRPPSARVARPGAAPDIRIPSPRVPSDLVRTAGTGSPAGCGRHRAVAVPASRLGTLALVAGRAGSLATLAALLVVSAAVAGVFDGSAPTGPAAQVATTTLR